jgi:polysaccharide deacetylase 2 family uncharacterized protein YibQ
LHRDRSVLDATLEALQPSGHALLTQKSGGFNSATSVATEMGVPSTAVARVIDIRRNDDGSPDPVSIRSALDRAALEANQSGATVVLGHTFPETITALFTWATEAKARSVTLAPVSAVIKRQAAEN